MLKMGLNWEISEYTAQTAADWCTVYNVCHSISICHIYPTKKETHTVTFSRGVYLFWFKLFKSLKSLLIIGL